MNIVLESSIYRKWVEESGLRPGSVATYKAGLTRLGEFIVQNGFDPSSPLDFANFYHSRSTGKYYPIDVRFIDEFIASLVSEGVSPASIRNTIDGMKSFFAFQYRNGILGHDILCHYPNRFYKPKIQDKNLTYQEVLALLAVARVLTNSSDEDYYLLVLLMVTCGLRAQEVCCLREDQLSWEGHTIIVNRGYKTNVRAVYMSDDLEEELRILICSTKFSDRRNTDMNPHVFYFEGKPLDYRRLRKMINKVVQATDPSLSVTPHTFRYTMAGLLCDDGVNVSAIQWQMRHERLTTTMHYLGVDARIARSMAEENAKRLLPNFPVMIEQLKILAKGLK